MVKYFIIRYKRITPFDNFALIEARGEKHAKALALKHFKKIFKRAREKLGECARMMKCYKENISIRHCDVSKDLNIIITWLG